MRARLTAAAAVVLIVTAAWVVPASAQYVGGQPPTIGQGPGARASADQVSQASQAKKVRIVRVIRVGASSLTASRSGGFAVTGADITQLALIGGSLIAVGAVLTRGARRRVAVTGGALH